MPRFSASSWTHLLAAPKIEFHARCDFLASQNLRCGIQIFETRVHAREQVGLLNRDLLLFHLGERSHDLHGIGTRYVWRHLTEIEHDPSRVDGVGIGSWRILCPIFDVFLRKPFHTRGLQPLMHALQILDRYFIHREPAHQRSPFGGHVGDGKARVHGEAGHAGAAEFDGGVQNFIVVVEAAQA